MMRSELLAQLMAARRERFYVKWLDECFGDAWYAAMQGLIDLGIVRALAVHHAPYYIVTQFVSGN